MTDLGAFSEATGINDLGQIVGVSFTTSGAVGHALLWQNGTMTDLGTLPNGTISLALSINDLGQIVGSSDTASRATHAVLWTMAAPPAFDFSLAEIGRASCRERV